MPEFSDLKSIYNHIEEHAFDYKYLHQIGDLFKQLRDKCIESGMNDEANKAQWEIDFLNFTIRGNELAGSFVFKNEEGNEIEYPSFDNFNDDTYDYLDTRLLSAENARLKARYAHILWLSPKKHRKYASTAIDSYLELISVYEKLDKELPEELYSHFMVKAARSALSIAIASGLDSHKAKSEIFRLLDTYSEESGSWPYLRYELIDLLLDQKQNMANSELGSLPQMCSETAFKLLTKKDLHGAIGFYEFGLKIDSKLQITTQDWNRDLAEANEALMQQRHGEPVVAHHYCEKALEYYRLIKDEAKIKQLEELRETYSQNTEFQEISTKFDISPYLDWCKSIANRMCCEPSGDIIHELATNQIFLPKYEDIKTLADESMTHTPFLSLVPEAITDDRGHTVQRVETQDEKKYVEILRVFGNHLRHEKFHLIHHVLSIGIHKEKLNTNTIVNYLKDYTWLGATFSRKLPNKRIYQYSWIDMLVPLLDNYFELMRKFLNDKIHIPNIVLCIDSFSLKFEGIIRDYCQLNGIVTSFDKRDKKGRLITQEKDLTILLRDSALESLVNPGDRLFFKFLFIEQVGYNLRHRIAHCLMDKEEYDLGQLHLLCMALLRLSSWEIRYKAANTQDS